MSSRVDLYFDIRLLISEPPALDGTQDVRCGGTEVRRSRWTFPRPLQGISKDLGFDGLDEVIRSRPSTSFLNASDSLLNASDSRVCRGSSVSFASAG